MPKVSWIGGSKKQPAPPCADLGPMFYGALKFKGLTLSDVGAGIGRTDDTTGRLIRHPENMTLGQAVAIARYLGISLEQLRAAIK